MDSFKKILNVSMLAIGMLIFCLILLIKVEVWAAKQEADIKDLSTQMEWNCYLYRKTAHNIIKNR